MASSRRWMRFSICSLVTAKAAKASSILTMASGLVSALVRSVASACAMAASMTAPGMIARMQARTRRCA